MPAAPRGPHPELPATAAMPASDPAAEPAASPGANPAPAAIAADPRFRVLARRYRPTSFDGLIGQEALVRTLSNAFRVGRIAHAYMLSGVRGVGKTTTARIIARALNCVGPDGTGGVTIAPCGVCAQCTAIAEDRHLDVIEMDAASHTGVDNIRELLDGVPYRPALARYKVYIIDEVHMLSEKAFNALLKTLEEPPEHVKFVFATTEIRKVPVTVLSRCQRFDLRRVDAATLLTHLARVATNEQVTVEPGALQLLARAADGSVRDGLSLLDQAIAHGGGVASEQTVRDMLGLADRQLSFDTLDAVMRGDAVTALAILDDQYRSGADPLLLIEDLLELTHWLTRVKLAPDSALGADVPEAERVRGGQMAAALSMADVTRSWQMLLKGLGETRMAPVPLHAAEMLLIRLAYASQLPSPADALEALLAGPGSGSPASGPPASGAPPAGRGGSGSAAGMAPARDASPGFGAQHGASAPPAERGPPADRGPEALARVPQPVPQPAPAVPSPVAARPSPSAPPRRSPASFVEVADLARDRHEGLLHGELMGDVHLVRFEPLRIELRLGERAAADLPQRLARFLLDATGERWMISVSQQPGEPSLREQRLAAETARMQDAAAHPLVRAILDTFPGAVLERLRENRVSGEAGTADPGAGDAGGAGEDPLAADAGPPDGFDDD